MSADEPRVDDAASSAAETDTTASTAEPAAAEPTASGATIGAPAAESPQPEVPFLRDLVGAMRGVAESSRDATLADLRQSLDQRLEEMKAASGERAEELRRRSELDLGGIGDWERSELERVRAEAEERRKARRELLEKELADHQAATDRDLEALRTRLADYEREMDAFFAQLAEINDPTAFVTAAKRMPQPPDLVGAHAKPGTSEAPKVTEAANGQNGTSQPDSGADTLAHRLAELDERLGTTSATATETAAAADSALTAATEPAAETQPSAPSGPAPSPAATATATASVTAPAATTVAAEASTPIVVKGLGSFGAITSFKQALERVEGIRGVTLSLGPTGDFVYRASHAPDFDLVAAIRSIEGPNAGIEDTDGQLRVTIERAR